MKQNNLMVIGLTGGIGTGKSTVSSYLSKLGYTVIDADKIAREVLKKGSQGLNEVRSLFGKAYIKEDGTLNRKKMRQCVFNDDQALKRLENITHPLIREKIHGLIDHYSIDPETHRVILDCPLLFEMSLDTLTDEDWLVSCSLETQINRIIKRDEVKRKDVMKIIEKQLPLHEKAIKSDVIIENEGTISELIKKIDKLVKERL